MLLATGAVASALLATSLTTGRQPITRALQRYQDHAVDVRLWGAPPPGSPSRLTITAVNTLGAGAHVFFASSDGASMHLKIAQPKDPHVESEAVMIRSARYVQWNGQRIAPTEGTPAVSITLTGVPAESGP